jgi:hypothetical protein
MTLAAVPRLEKLSTVGVIHTQSKSEYSDYGFEPNEKERANQRYIFAPVEVLALTLHESGQKLERQLTHSSAQEMEYKAS